MTFSTGRAGGIRKPPNAGFARKQRSEVGDQRSDKGSQWGQTPSPSLRERVGERLCLASVTGPQSVQFQASKVQLAATTDRQVGTAEGGLSKRGCGGAREPKTCAQHVYDHLPISTLPAKLYRRKALHQGQPLSCLPFIEWEKFGGLPIRTLYERVVKCTTFW